MQHKNCRGSPGPHKCVIIRVHARNNFTLKCRVCGRRKSYFPNFFFIPTDFKHIFAPLCNIINTRHHNIIIKRNSLTATRPIITPRHKYFLVHVKVHLSRTIEISDVIIIIIYYTFVSQSFQMSASNPQYDYSY